MTRITWNDTGENRFETGVDRGVLFYGDPVFYAAAWDGLIGVDEVTQEGSTPYFIDGVKYLDVEAIGDYQATIRAFTYPTPLDSHTGVIWRGNGLFADDQPSLPIGFSYRTKLGNDVNGVDAGYKLHIIWNAYLTPQTVAHNTITADPELVEFAWDLVALPSVVGGFKPTAHLVLDSTQFDPDLLTLIENTIYGTEFSIGYLPSLEEFVAVVAIGFVIDNGDGTWTIIAPDANVTEVGGQFEILSEAEGVPVYVDADTWTITTTPF